MGSRFVKLQQDWIEAFLRQKRKARWRRASNQRNMLRNRSQQLADISRQSYRQRLQDLELRSAISRHPVSAPREDQAGDRVQDGNQRRRRRGDL